MNVDVYNIKYFEIELDETIFYNLNIYEEHEDLIVFPMHEFIDFLLVL